jgi:hypothetical protein
MLPAEIFLGEPRSSCRSRPKGSTRAGPGRGRGSWKNVLGATLKRPNKKTNKNNIYNNFTNTLEYDYFGATYNN